MGHKCKRIIDGKTYNTETATHLTSWDYGDGFSPYSYGEYLYQTRFGAFFKYEFKDGSYDDDYERIIPLTPEDAREWLEKRDGGNTELIESLFGEMPEAGSGEVKFTLRMPESLKNRLAARAVENRQSLNAWMVRCLEGCAGDPESRRGG